MRRIRKSTAAAGAVVVALTVAAAACGAGDRAEAAGGAATVLDATEARKSVLDLYLTRQEYIELYYGPGGGEEAPEAVGEAVERAEARFHELMRILGETPPPPSDRVAQAIEAVTSAHVAVLEAAEAADVPLTPTDRSTEGTPDGGLEDWIADVRTGLESIRSGYDPSAGTTTES